VTPVSISSVSEPGGEGDEASRSCNEKDGGDEEMLEQIKGRIGCASMKGTHK